MQGEPRRESSKGFRIGGAPSAPIRARSSAARTPGRSLGRSGVSQGVRQASLDAVCVSESFFERLSVVSPIYNPFATHGRRVTLLHGEYRSAMKKKMEYDRLFDRKWNTVEYHRIPARPP